MTPDPCRVIIKLFVPGQDAALVHTRAAAVIERIAHLDEDESSRLLNQTMERFGTRHHDLEATFRHHYDLVRHRVAASSDLSPTARTLVGAYFSHEYAVEAAALCNPSMVAHPDQSALRPAQLRVAISLRQIGEGHISSIGFATGVLGPDTRLAVADRSGPLQTGHRSSARHRRDLLAAAVADEGCDNEVSATVLGYLPEHFDDDDFERALGRIPADLLTRNTTHSTLEQLRRMTAASYAVTFPAEVPLDRRILWPTAPPESNGMEDAASYIHQRQGRIGLPRHLHRLRRPPHRRPQAQHRRPRELRGGCTARAGNPKQRHGTVPANRRRPSPGPVPL